MKKIGSLIFAAVFPVIICLMFHSNLNSYVNDYKIKIAESQLLVATKAQKISDGELVLTAKEVGDLLVVVAGRDEELKMINVLKFMSLWFLYVLFFSVIVNGIKYNLEKFKK